MPATPGKSTTPAQEPDLTDFLIGWIHRVETQAHGGNAGGDAAGKRLPGLVTEAYFERALRLQMWSGVPTEFSTGWAYRTERRGGYRSWFKISDGTSMELNHAFVRQLLASRRRDQFFVIHASLGDRLDKGVPTIHWQLQRVDGDSRAGKRLDQSRARALGATIEDAVNEALQARRGLRPRAQIAHRLRQLDTGALRQLLFTRCLMNFGKLFLTDVDAIARTPTGELEFIEFKRKSPAAGNDAWQRDPPPTGEDVAQVYLEEAKQLANDFNPPSADFARLPKAEMRKRMDEANRQLADHLKKSSRWRQAQPYPGLSLDLSHVRNVQLAADVGMNYRYIIWQSGVSNPDILFEDGELVPRDEQTLLSMLVKPQHFDRMTKTSGGDSGTYTGRIRFQLLIPVGHFAPLRQAPRPRG